MSERIEETLKRLAAATSKGTLQTSGIDNKEHLGDPECQRCGGVGYLRADVPIEHPSFGKLEICSCRQAAVRAQLRKRLFRFSNLDELKHLTFDTFDPIGRHNLPEYQQESLKAVYEASKRYSHNLDGWFVVQGTFGCGKTHLAAAIANECASLGVPTLFLTVPDLLDSLRFAFNSEDTTFEERFEQIRTAPLLILDDFGTQNATEWAQEKLFQILNYRYVNGLPLVVTTNLPFEQIEGRMRSRLLEAINVTYSVILAPDYRLGDDQQKKLELSSLEYHKDQTFDTFKNRKAENLPPEHLDSLTDAYNASRKFAKKPEGWLVLIGGFGCGKTHLAAAIANHRANQGFPVMFIVVPDLLDHLRSTFNPNSTISYDRRFEEIRKNPLLILDDLGTQATTPWVREKLYQLFNHRYNAQLPTVITTADTLEKVDDRLRARMADRRLVKGINITAPVYRGKDKNRK